MNIKLEEKKIPMNYTKKKNIQRMIIIYHDIWSHWNSVAYDIIPDTVELFYVIDERGTSSSLRIIITFSFIIFIKRALSMILRTRIHLNKNIHSQTLGRSIKKLQRPRTSPITGGEMHIFIHPFFMFSKLIYSGHQAAAIR